MMVVCELLLEFFNFFQLFFKIVILYDWFCLSFSEFFMKPLDIRTELDLFLFILLLQMVIFEQTNQLDWLFLNLKDLFSQFIR